MGPRCRRTRCTTDEIEVPRVGSSESSYRASSRCGRTSLSGARSVNGNGACDVSTRRRHGGPAADDPSRAQPRQRAAVAPVARAAPATRHPGTARPRGRARSRVPVAMGDLPLDRRRDVGARIASMTYRGRRASRRILARAPSGSIPPTVPERTPAPGGVNFLQRRKGAVRDASTHEMLDTTAVTAAWETALEASEWDAEPRWVHGDVLGGNVLTSGRRLRAIIDWGSAAVGDPPCDLMAAWSLFSGESRTRFRNAIAADRHERGRGLGGGQSTESSTSGTTPTATRRSWRTQGTRSRTSWRTSRGRLVARVPSTWTPDCPQTNPERSVSRALM